MLRDICATCTTLEALDWALMPLDDGALMPPARLLPAFEALMLTMPRLPHDFQIFTGFSEWRAIILCRARCRCLAAADARNYFTLPLTDARLPP